MLLKGWCEALCRFEHVMASLRDKPELHVLTLFPTFTTRSSFHLTGLRVTGILIYPSVFPIRTVPFFTMSLIYLELHFPLG